MYRCIGQKRIKNHANEKGELIQCTKESETPSNPDKPEWGWLCPDCANSVNHHSVSGEKFNANATQDDIEEYKDQIESGVMTGIRGSFRDGSGDD